MIRYVLYSATLCHIMRLSFVMPGSFNCLPVLEPGGQHLATCCLVRMVPERGDLLLYFQKAALLAG